MLHTTNLPSKTDDWLPVLALACALLTAAGTAQASAILTTDGEDEMAALALGTDLFVGASGLPGGAVVEIVLSSPFGETLVNERRITDEAGELEPSVLWYRTGIGGCDCDLQSESYPYRYPEEASELVGLGVTIELYAVGSKTLLAGLALPVVDFTAPLIYTANSRGCPRRLVPVGETLFLASHDPIGLAATVFLVADRKGWPVGTPLEDVRVGFPVGQVISGTGTAWSEVLWHGVEAEVGAYDLIIRWHSAAGTSLSPHLQSSDQVLELPKSKFKGYSAGGLAVDDWDCL